MTAKEKVLKIRPDAYLSEIHNYQVFAGCEDNRVKLSNPQIYRSWAWAEAYRNLTNQNQSQSL